MKLKRGVIYVHGANGSGKSTLARVVIACSGGVSDTARNPQGTVVSYTRHGPALIGAYRTATGGADGVQPYAAVPAAIKLLLRSHNVFCEGLMTPGVETCRGIYEAAKRMDAGCMFILLDVPTDVCTSHVLLRRARKGNEKEYNTAHLLKKHKNAASWANNLRAAKIPVGVMTWEGARDYCLGTFGINADTATGILD